MLQGEAGEEAVLLPARERRAMAPQRVPASSGAVGGDCMHTSSASGRQCTGAPG
jgi:hypothetical protein